MFSNSKLVIHVTLYNSSLCLIVWGSTGGILEEKVPIQIKIITLCLLLVLKREKQNKTKQKQDGHTIDSL